MSTEEDGHTLTRKQLRELRMTGSTPVISEQQAAAAPPAATQPTADERAADAGSTSGDSHPVAGFPTPPSGAPLTRRAARAQERSRTGGVPVSDDDAVAEDAAVVDEPVVDEPVVEEVVVEEPVVEEAVVDEPVVDVPAAAEPVTPTVEPERAGIVSGIPAFTPAPAPAPRDGSGESADSDRPMVGAAFGIGVKRSASGHSAPAAFDDLLETGSAGPHKTASTLIFTPSPGAGSLSGPVASTGELLITGTYALPEGLGSQGHALGTTDGKDIDAVLIDGELAPASSPTPIAASSAISTSKPAGEVIRPPAPDKGGRLTLTLAIVAGGLALALAAALIIAFTTGVLG